MVPTTTTRDKPSRPPPPPLQPRGWTAPAWENQARQARAEAETQRRRVDQLTRRNRRLRSATAGAMTILGTVGFVLLLLGAVFGYAIGAGLVGLVGGMSPLRDRRNFPGLLADLREGKGWSQNALAVEAGLSPSYVCLLEAGKREPSRDTIAALATTLDLSTTDRCSLYICAGYLPDGHWVAIDDWLIRPAAISKERYP